MEEAITFSKKYLEDVLSFFGLNVDVHATHDEDVIELNIPSTHMNGFLIGQRGDTIRALQYIVTSALNNKNFGHMRVNVDVADYKKAQNDRLAEQVEHWAQGVKTNKKDMELQPMNPAFRRIVHKVASESGLTTESVGDGYNRRVIIKAAGFDLDIPVETEEPKASKPTKSKESADSTNDSKPSKEGKATPKTTKPTKASRATELTKDSESKPKDSKIKKPASSLRAKLLKSKK